MLKLNNIKIQWKFRLAALGFLIPLTVLLALLISEKNISIDFAKKELQGVNYLTVFSDILSDIHNIEEAGHLPADAGKVNFCMASLDKNFIRLGRDKNNFNGLFHYSVKLNEAIRLWDKIKNNKLEGKSILSPESKLLFKDLESSVSGLITFVGDASNLILDPDLQSYYLIEINVGKIPEQINYLNRLSELTAKDAGKKYEAVNIINEIIILSGLLRSNEDGMISGLSTSLNNNKDYKISGRLKSLLDSNARAVGNLLSALKSEKGNYPAAETIRQSVSRAEKSAFGFWKFSIDEMKLLLENRINNFNNNKILTIAVVCLIIGITLLFFLFLSKGIIRSVTRLDTAAGKVMGGDYNCEVEAAGTDELGSLSKSFNQMIAIVSQSIREHAEKLEQTESALSLEKDEHKLVANALNRSEMLFSQLWNISVDGMRLVDEEGTIIALNDAYCKIICKPKEEILGKNYLECYSFEQKDIISQQFEKDFSGNFEHTHFERETVLWNGKTLWLEMSNSFLTIPGTGRCILSIVKDITERKKDEETLKNFTGQLRNLASRLQTIREEERTMVAREIHDELGQVLTVLKIQISLLSNKLREDQQSLKEKISSISRLIDTIVESVQKISSKLRPGILDDLGLISALEWQSQEFQNNTGITCNAFLPKDDLSLDKEKATAIFRIFQESLTNIARHANASNVEVKLLIAENNLELEISDNGKGITGKQIADSKSLGLLGMKERALILGGNVSIEGARDKGTKVKVVMPVWQ
jgi:PAS domain S-box-containing protein